VYFLLIRYIDNDVFLRIYLSIYFIKKEEKYRFTPNKTYLRRNLTKPATT
jgi:hypothetical protein